MTNVVPKNLLDLLLQNIGSSALHDLEGLATNRFGTPTEIKAIDSQVKWGEILRVNATDGDVNVFLPRISLSTIGKSIVIKKTDSSTNSIYVWSADGQLINSATSINTNGALATIIATSVTLNNWFAKYTDVVVPPTPDVFHYYALYAEGLRKRDSDTDTWETVTLPGSPDELYHIHGLSLDNIWIVGHDTGGKGYVAVDLNDGNGFTRVNSHATYGTHPYDNVALSDMVGVQVFAADDIWTVTKTTVHGGYVLHQWNGSSWTQRYAPANNIYPIVVKANASRYAIAAPPYGEIHYSTNGGASWSSWSWPGGWQKGVVFGATSAEEYIVGKYMAAATKLEIYEGLPGSPFDLVGEYTPDPGESIGTGTWNGDRVFGYVDENDDLFCHCEEAGPVQKNYMIYNFRGTPERTEIGVYGRGWHGTSSTNVTFKDINIFNLWDGSTLSQENPALGAPGLGQITATWCWLEEGS